jgi:hypothetical protein
MPTNRLPYGAYIRILLSKKRATVDRRISLGHEDASLRKVMSAQVSITLLYGS